METKNLIIEINVSEQGNVVVTVYDKDNSNVWGQGDTLSSALEQLRTWNPLQILNPLIIDALKN